MTKRVDHYLDTTGLTCPEPVMLLHKAMRDVGEGQVIQVIASDPSTERDIPKFCQFLGHELLDEATGYQSISPEGKVQFCYLIRKKRA